MVGHPWEAIPINLSFKELAKLKRLNVLPGVSLQELDGSLAASISECAAHLPIRPGIAARHVLVVNKAQYLRGLDRRLAVEKKHREIDLVDSDGILRQVCVAITLRFRLPWAYAGSYHLKHLSSGQALISSYQHRPTVRWSDHLLWSVPNDWYRPVHSKPLAKTMLLLDPYYRSGTWRWDRFSVALGYFWSALTTTHGELAFAAMSMALEAVCDPGKNEITHQLAERCAILARRELSERLETYKEVKSLYGIRSDVVHGRPRELKKGSTSKEWSKHLFVSAKRTAIPGAHLLRMLNLTSDVLAGVVENKTFRGILQRDQSESDARSQIDAYFFRTLLS